MPKPRTPTNVLDARGSFKNHPERKRVDPETEAFPETAPSHLNPLQVKWWHKIKAAVPDGVLQSSDVFTVELTAVLWAEFVSDPKAMPTARITQMRSLFGSLGMSPSDRAKLASKPGNEYDDEF